MGATPVLGPIAFQGYEVPERISIGGRQQLALHNLPGGGRVIDAMGPDEGPIEWSGIFTGLDASDRVRSLERLRRNGQTLVLGWENWRYSVVIESFTAEVASPWLIPYHIRLCVVPDQIAGSDDDSIFASGASADSAATANIDDEIEVAAAALGAADLASAIAASGQLAQLVRARALSNSKS